MRASQLVLEVKNLPPSAGDKRDAGLIPELERYPRGGYGNPLQYSCLENPIDRGTWWALVHRVAKNQTRLSNLAHKHNAAAAKSLLCDLETAAHQAPPSLGFSRQEHGSGLPFPSPVHESEK